MAMEAGTAYKRSYMALFLDENFNKTSPNFVIQGKTIESASYDFGINTESTVNILDEVNVQITEYTPTFQESTYTCVKGDKIWVKLYDNVQKRATAGEYETEAVDVILDSEGNIEKAHKTTVRVIPASMGADGGKELQVDFTINYTGTPEELDVTKCSISNGVFTYTA